MSAELESLVRKVKVIHTVTGGTEKPSQRKKTTIDSMQHDLVDHLRNAEELEEKMKLEPDKSYSQIRFKHQLRAERHAIAKNIQDLDAFLKKTKKVDDTVRQNVMSIISQAKEQLPIDPQHYAAKGTTLDELIAGKYTKREQTTYAQQKQIDEIHDEHKIQDQLLDEMEKAAETLKRTAENIGDELQKSNVIINNALSKTTSANVKIEKVIERTDYIHKQIKSRSGKICMYLICVSFLAILLYIFMKIL